MIGLACRPAQGESQTIRFRKDQQKMKKNTKCVQSQETHRRSHTNSVEKRIKKKQCQNNMIQNLNAIPQTSILKDNIKTASTAAPRPIVRIPLNP